MKIVKAQLEGHGRPIFAHCLVGFFLHLLHDLFDTRRVNAAVRDQTFDGLLGDLAAVRIESRQDDGAGRVVDDQVDPGGELERPDVAALTADDAPLEVVARQIDDGDGRLNRVLRAAPLNRFGDVVFGAVDGGFARLGVEPLEQVGRFVTGLVLDLPEEELLGLFSGEARDPLQLVLLLHHEAIVLGGGGGGCLLAIGDGPIPGGHFLLEAIDGALALRQRRLAPSQRLLEHRGRLFRLAHLAVGLHQQLVRLFLGLEERLFLARFRVALGVFDGPARLFVGASDGFGCDPLAVRHPRGEHEREGHQCEEEVDQRTVYRQHA
jgi:hypothetical protein